MSPSPPALSPIAPIQDRNLSDLRMLSILHCVLAALTLLPSGLYLFTISAAVIAATPEDWQDTSFLVGLLTFGVLALLFLVSVIMEILLASCLTRFRHRTFCMGAAVWVCLNIPLGTVLGIWTLRVLARSSVNVRFNSMETA